MTICLVGDPEDLTSVYVRWLAEKQQVHTLVLPEQDLGLGWSFGYHDPGISRGWIEANDERYRFSEITGFFVRFHPEPPLPSALDLAEGQREVFVLERRAGLENLLDDVPGCVVNRPSSGRSNGSKPHQMALLERHGLEVPRWITANRPDLVEQFTRSCEHGAVFKSCSGLRSRVRSIDDEILERLRRGSPPLVAQELIPGRDVRVHLVGDQAFATEIVADTVDYRFDDGEKEYRPTNVPADITAACNRARAADGLVLAGLDFRVTSGGRWYCLEMNPVPSFLPYEMEGKQPIGPAILEMLTKRVPVIQT